VAFSIEDERMTDAAKPWRRQDDDDFEERAGWQKPVKPPAADAKAPGPAPKAVTSPATEKEASSDD
jgi:hypothetical protein